MDEALQIQIRERTNQRRIRRMRQARNARPVKTRKGAEPVIVVMTPEEGLVLLNAYSNPRKGKKKKGNEDDEVVNADAMEEKTPIVRK